MTRFKVIIGCLLVDEVVEFLVKLSLEFPV